MGEIVFERDESMDVSEVIKRYKDLIGAYFSKVDQKNIAESIVKDFRKVLDAKKIILYGAGCVGRDFVHLFREMGIAPVYVVDKNWEEIKECCGIRVMDPVFLKQIGNPDEYILIAASDRKLFREIWEDIQRLETNFSRMECGHDIHILLQSAWCMLKAENGHEINLRNCYECTCLDNTCRSLCRYLKRMNGYEDQLGSGTEKVEMIGYLLSNVCTLNCKNCCESVPYMPEGTRHFVPAEQVVQDIQKLSAACRYLILLEFIGGEPFLHPQLSQILKEVLKIRNIGMIHIFTNGTVVPDDELCGVLKSQRITVYLSNYQISYPQQLKEKVGQTTGRLDAHGVLYFFGKKQSWMDFSSYELQCDKEEELKKKYPDCFLHNCNRLMEGELYVCPHQYAGIRLGKLERKDVIPIHAYTDEGLAEALDTWKANAYIDACRYCSMPYNAPVVLSGEQL
ncbi:MAG: radical SAM protein [Eubacterium sp.]|nr:radical SAM protein [Eubacterium sp.]